MRMCLCVCVCVGVFDLAVISPSSTSSSWPQRDNGCVSIQGPHPSKAAFEDRLRHSGTSRLYHFEGSFKCGREMQSSFPGFEGSTGWILHGPTYPKIHCALDFLDRVEAAAAANDIFNDKTIKVRLGLF